MSPQFISAGVLFAALAAASTASAANWEVAPRVEAGYRYSDNYHLGPPGTEVDVSGGETDARVTFRTLDPRTQVEITPRVQATYFPDDPDDDSVRSEEHTSELQSRLHLVCRLLLEKK